MRSRFRSGPNATANFAPFRQASQAINYVALRSVLIPFSWPVPSPVSSSTDPLPLSQTIVPNDQEELRAAVERAYRSGTPIYPIGGGTSLDFGLSPKQPGIGLSLAKLNRVIDYPARDMTITVEAGITINALAKILAKEGQRLPIDVPDADRATLGGVIATNTSGPRRMSSGTIRDYVIGISAVDGRGMLFHGGGRVVKNVAGYDFCKLLCGSLGTLGIVTQVTLKLKPLPPRSVLLTCAIRDWTQADELLAATVNSNVTPAAVELLSGPAWVEDLAFRKLPSDGVSWLVVGLEGTAAEVDWLLNKQREEWLNLRVAPAVVSEGDEAVALWQRLAQFPAAKESPLVLKFSVRSSQVPAIIKAVRTIDPHCSLQAHAVNGVVIVRFKNFAAAEVGKLLPGTLQPLAKTAGGSVVVLSWNGGGELTRQAYWGTVDAAGDWMLKVQQQFDPKRILNPGRFVV